VQELNQLSDHFLEMAFWILATTLSFFSALLSFVCLIHFLYLEFSDTTLLSLALEMTFLTGYFFSFLTLFGAFLIS